MSKPTSSRDLPRKVAKLSINDTKSPTNVLQGTPHFETVKKPKSPHPHILNEKQETEVYSNDVRGDETVRFPGEFLTKGLVTWTPKDDQAPHHLPRFLQMSDGLGFSRFNISDLSWIANLPPEANIVLFAPVVPDWNVNTTTSNDSTQGDRHPGGGGGPYHSPEVSAAKSDSQDSEAKEDPYLYTPVDPFEDFGSCLEIFHQHTRHVPYVPTVGFTATHATYTSQADGIITLMCEPGGDNHMFKDQSMQQQMDFAISAHNAMVEENAGDEEEAEMSGVPPRVEVVVQCASPHHRIEITPHFHNVIEALEYTSIVAQDLAERIFVCRQWDYVSEPSQQDHAQL